jgi:NAD(P)-dependent dehydrogenase (short-subunit alcohol dehydrogenase family)
MNLPPSGPLQGQPPGPPPGSLPGRAPDPATQLFDESLGRAPGRGRMAGRRIVVVGAGQRDTVDADPPVGNGRAIAMLCAREGAQVACIDRAQVPLEHTCALIAGEGGRAHAFVADASDAAQLDAALERSRDAMGGIDGLAMVVGISHGRPLSKMDVDTWDREFAVNVRSNMIAGKKAVALLEDGGAIVVVSSIASLRASGNPAYEASKSAQLALVRAIAGAGQSRGIRCNALLPGLIDTPMGRDASRARSNRTALPLPFRRQGTGWEVGYAALFLLSHESSYVNAHTMVVDGGVLAGVGMRPREA